MYYDSEKSINSIHTDGVNGEKKRLFFFQSKNRNFCKNCGNTQYFFTFGVSSWVTFLSFASRKQSFSQLITLRSLFKYFSLSIFLFGSVSIQSVFLVLSLSRLCIPGWPGYDSDFLVTPIKFTKVAHLRIDA